MTEDRSDEPSPERAGVKRAENITPPSTSRWQSLSERRISGEEEMKHFYENVPRLGNVAVSRHAQA